MCLRSTVNSRTRSATAPKGLRIGRRAVIVVERCAVKYPRMKIATWNVNGIRARESQFCDWLERDQPDVLCLQEIKARPDQVPDRCKLADYHAFWHGAGGYSGVSLHLHRSLLDAPEFAHPEFDIETRIVQVALDNL